MTRSLIIGSTGQIGAYLSRELLSNGHEVVATTRNLSQTPNWRFRALGIDRDVTGLQLDPSNSDEIQKAIKKHEPAQIFLLCGPSSVGDSFQRPLETVTMIVDLTRSVLQALDQSKSAARLINVGSSEIFGDQAGILLSEDSPRLPVSPYALGKTISTDLVSWFRTNMGLNASNAILTNTESPLRGSQFVTPKIVAGLRRFLDGDNSNLEMGRVDIERDWLWASDAAAALVSIGSNPQPDDFIVSTGESHSLLELIKGIGSVMGLDNLESRILTSHELSRPADISGIRLNSAKLRAATGWRNHVSFDELCAKLAEGAFDESNL